ncbi:hypothetical protein [Actinacidiphila oryziradicis]|uniref:Uncharacterized protein n=1 Tax=Actinacidiphila oryziradicis TaxID=2571141 RepID=A0A4U0RVV3_9ACTN|nr:hypothetical protein [Actinacidiphila oryziradicis]TJZ99697.1 hypothetical protein FCI23_44730 [Actinacidiphila oryziradicis]
MAVTISLAFLFGILLAILLRAGAIKAGSCFVAVMFGFYLASTGASGPINALSAAVATTLNGLF